MDLGWLESLLPLGLLPIGGRGEVSTLHESRRGFNGFRIMAAASRSHARDRVSKRYAASPSPNQPRLSHTEESPRRARAATTARLAAANERGGMGRGERDTGDWAPADATGARSRRPHRARP